VRKDKVQELLDGSPYIKKANTLAELARKIEVDVESFLSTISATTKPATTAWSGNGVRQIFEAIKN
jgi:hypothetical protein